MSTPLDGPSAHQPDGVPDPGDSAPFKFTKGPLEGRTLHFELQEIQGAAIGRKYVSNPSSLLSTTFEGKSGQRRFTRKDRRPLDPPPVIVCKVFESTPSESGSPVEREVPDYNIPTFNVGFICQAELFTSEDEGLASEVAAGSAPSPGTACTEQLAGTTFTQGLVLPIDGKHVLIFAFTDLSVKQIGMFHLRYKCYSLFSQLDGLHERPSLAECTGDPFRVYSTTSCPTLAPSTALSKHLSLLGIRINTRQNERKKREPSRGNVRLAPQRVNGASDDEEDQEEEEG